MNERNSNQRSPSPVHKLAALCVAVLILGACQKTAAPTADAADAKAKPAAAAKDAGEAKTAAGDEAKGEAAGKDEEAKGEKGEEGKGVTLTAEQVEKLGLETQAAVASDYRQETTGYGVVVPHETIATAVAELTQAQATSQQSHAALARAQRLTGTPGAVSADVEETAVRQAAVDEATLTLSHQKLASVVGMRPPWKPDESSGLLQELAGGAIKLVRVTFPLGTLSGGVPATLRATHISGTTPETGWKLNSPWVAPADATVPGRSFFALLKGSDASEGERLMVFAPVGAAATGALVPVAAVVLSEGQYWCYLEKDEGHFVRTPLDTTRPTAEGYFVTAGVEPGDKVVTAAAGLLLAKETNSGSEPD
jgi:hypothetical protein